MASTTVGTSRLVTYFGGKDFPFVHCGFLNAALDVVYEVEQTNFKENKFGKGKFFEVFYTGLKYFG